MDKKSIQERQMHSKAEFIAEVKRAAVEFVEELEAEDEVLSFVAYADIGDAVSVANIGSPGSLAKMHKHLTHHKKTSTGFIALMFFLGVLVGMWI